jgi:hypothetical protein
METKDGWKEVKEKSMGEGGRKEGGKEGRKEDGRK